VHLFVLYIVKIFCTARIRTIQSSRQNI